MWDSIYILTVLTCFATLTCSRRLLNNTAANDFKAQDRNDAAANKKAADLLTSFFGPEYHGRSQQSEKLVGNVLLSQ